MKNSLNHLDEGAEKLNHSPESNKQQPEGISHKEQLEHDANKEWGTEKARKQFEHIETKESTQEELEDFKKSHTTTHQNTKQTQTRTMRPEHINPRMHTYSSADEGRSAAHKHVIQDIANMQSFFGRKKAA